MMGENNDKYKMDQLVEKGWADMEKKLDAAMPSGENKKQRILPVLILLMIAVAAGGTFIYFLSQGNTARQKNEELVTDQSVDYALDQSEFSDQAKVLPSGTNNQKTDEQAKAGEINITASVPTMDDQPVYTSDRKLLKGDKKVFSTNSVQHASSVTLAEKYSMAENGQNTTGPTVMDPAPASHAPIKQPGIIQPVRIRQLAQKNLYDNNRMKTDKTDLALNFKNDISTRFCRNEFAFQTGMITENLASMGGFEFGFYYRKYFNEQLFLSAGLSYLMMDKKHFSNAMLKTGIFGLSGNNAEFDAINWVEKRYEYELLNAEIRNNTIGYEYVLGLVNRLHYLQLPVNIGYKWHRFGIQGGLNLAWMVYGSNAVRDFSEVYFNTIVLSDEVLFNKQMFSRFDLSPQLGWEYQIWKGLTLYSYYNHGLVQIAKAESAAKIGNASFEDRYEDIPTVRVDRNRYFVLGLRYNLSFCQLRQD